MNANGEIGSRIGVTLSVEEFNDAGKNQFLPNFVTILEKLWQNRFSEIVPKIGILNFQNYSNGLNFNVWSFFGSLS